MMEKLPEEADIRVAFQEAWTDTAKKTLIAFANTLGGKLYFGMSDEGAAKGLSKKEVDQISRSVLQFCRTGAEPVMTDLVSTKVIAAGRGRYLLRVSVDPGEDRPYAFKGQRYTGGAYVRDGAMSVTANEDELRGMIRESAPESWEARLSRKADLSFAEASDIFRKHQVVFSPAHYRPLGLVDDAGYYTHLGELLSDQNQRSLAIEIFSQDAAALSVREVSGSLLRQIDQVFDFFAAVNLEVIEKTEKLSNKRQFAWPPKALREALVNCAVHRDYSQPEPTKVSIFPNRAEFLPYGRIPRRLSVEDIVLEGVSQCRNERLADIFRRLGWMKNYGSGFSMIWREYANTGAAPKLEATRSVFRIVLPKIQLEEPRPLKERSALLFESHDVLSMAEVMTMLNISRTSANSTVNALLRSGKVEKVGTGRLTRYRSLLR